jgi:hypothetical protein
LNEEQWRRASYDEWVGRTTGARSNIDQARGADARMRQEASHRAMTNYEVKLPNFGPPSNLSGGRGTYRPPRGPSEPWFPFVDRWLAAVPRWFVLALAGVGGLFGYGYGVEAGAAAPLGYAIGGGIAGFVALPILAMAVKLALAAIVFGIFAIVVYLMFTMLGG